MKKRKFNNKFIFALILLLIIFFLVSFVLSISSYTSPATPTGSANPAQNQDDWETQNVEQLTGIGNLLGLKNNNNFVVQNAQVKSKGGVVEVVLNNDGKIIYKQKDSMFGLEGTGSFDSKSLDMSKKNRFVFKGNLMTEAEFTTKSNEGKTIYNIFSDFNNKNVDIPGGAKVVLKDDILKIYCNEGSKLELNEPSANDDNKPSNLKVNYIANGKDILLFNPRGEFLIPLKEGELSFSGENGRIDLLGEKVVFGNTKEDITDEAGIILKNLEIKNFNAEKGTSIIFGHSDNFVNLDKPYINIESLSSPMSINICAISLNCLNGQFVTGYKIDIVPDKNGFGPEMRFNPGNPIFPEMKDGQYISINSGDKRASLKVDFVATGNSLTEVRPDLKFLSSNGELLNSGNKYLIKEENGKYEWQVSRVLNEQYPFSRITFAESKRMGLTAYHDATQTSNEYVTFVSKAVPENDMIPGVSLGDEISDTDLVFKIKTNIINALEGTAKKLFGYEKGKEIGDKLFNLLFSNERLADKSPRP